MLADELSLIQQHITNRDLIGIVLEWLNLDYGVIVNFVQNMSTPPSLEELYSMLLNHENHLDIYHQPSPDRKVAALFIYSKSRNCNF